MLGLSSSLLVKAATKIRYDTYIEGIEWINFHISYNLMLYNTKHIIYHQLLVMHLGSINIP